MPKIKTNPHALYAAQPIPIGPARSKLEELAECVQEIYSVLYFIMPRESFDDLQKMREFRYTNLLQISVPTADDLARAHLFPKSFEDKLKEHDILKNPKYHH